MRIFFSFWWTKLIWWFNVNWFFRYKTQPNGHEFICRDVQIKSIFSFSPLLFRYGISFSDWISTHWNGKKKKSEFRKMIFLIVIIGSFRHIFIVTSQYIFVTGWHKNALIFRTTFEQLVKYGNWLANAFQCHQMCVCVCVSLRFHFFPSFRLH